MSFDLGVWYSSQPLTAAEAEERYSALHGNENGNGNGMGNANGQAAMDERLTRFVDELTSRYPQIDDVADDEIDACPWTLTFEFSPTHVRMPVMWARAEEIAPVVMEIADRHGLVCYDPQSRKIHLPPGLRSE